MFKPYRKLAKSSLKRARLSCMSWKCIMLASRSAMASDSSAKAGSKVLSGKEASSSPALRAELRNEDRDDGRRGVVGRDVCVLELGRLSAESFNGVDIAWRSGQIAKPAAVNMNRLLVVSTNRVSGSCETPQIVETDALLELWTGRMKINNSAAPCPAVAS